MKQNLGKLEQMFGYRFQNIGLLERALTHRSWAYENKPSGSDEEIRNLQNESLEFVGDSVLGLAIAEQLFNRNPDSSEGDLTLMKHYLVSADTLGRIALNYDLGSYLRVGRGEEKTGGRKKQALLADTLEAVIGAIFFDTGYISARAFINRIFADELKKATPRNSIDYKTLLQETLQAKKLSAPEYNVVSTDGPPHERVFTVEAVWEEGRVRAEGNSIKSAEMTAASMVLEKLGEPRSKAKK
ncbi:MAG: ribonuclease III [Pyrinomonadaceae bacterium]|nr:ribonuclease III [Pyrinomonadaceae bacterium]